MNKNKNVIALLVNCMIFSGCTTHVMAPVITSKDNAHNSYKGPTSSPQFVLIKEADLPPNIENPLGSSNNSEYDFIKEKDIHSDELRQNNIENDLNVEPSGVDKELDLELELTKLNLDNLQRANKPIGTNINKDDSKIIKPNVKKDSLPVDGVLLNRFGDIVDNKKLTGINIASKAGTSVLAVRSGVVIHAKYDKTYGNIVIIENKENKIHTAYAHLQNIMVHEGEVIRSGQVIGKVGNSGSKAVEPMLHFVVRHNKTPVDPINYLNLQEVE